MVAYHQMGHQSDNLVDATELASFGGAILSPVNYSRSQIETFIKQNRKREGFELIFDPQLYYPRTPKEKLRSWSYFPNEFETTDYTAPSGWSSLIDTLAQTVTSLEPHAVCTPAIVPRRYTDEYFGLGNEIAEMLIRATKGFEVSVLQTVVVALGDLTDFSHVKSISSIITASRADRVYLVFGSSAANPRRELTSTEELKGAMLLIDSLQTNGVDTLVGFCSSELILWKAAGATSCATGKFWNTRRFNEGRWAADADQGSGQVAYFFEESLLAFLRESDILRTTFALSDASLRNPYYEEIKNRIAEGQAWVGHGWRQYLYWFADIERRLSSGETDATTLLKSADNMWGRVEEEQVILEERGNNGGWIRPWLRSVLEYRTPW
ncbi:MAG: hypothetical protein IPM16_22545 [Chloroflexi bacterium]|nr:hypothetical protein [Chloroflexota bacterium]